MIAINSKHPVNEKASPHRSLVVAQQVLHQALLVGHVARRGVGGGVKARVKAGVEVEVAAAAKGVTAVRCLACARKAAT